jgi:hypothetical protein
MAMERVDQIAPPMASAAPTSQARRVSLGAARMRPASSSAVKEAKAPTAKASTASAGSL